jgi:hypothetical protein
MEWREFSRQYPDHEELRHRGFQEPCQDMAGCVFLGMRAAGRRTDEERVLDPNSSHLLGNVVSRNSIMSCRHV